MNSRTLAATAATAALLLAGCGRNNPAILAEVTLAPAHQASCVEISVLSEDGQVLGAPRQLERPSGKDLLSVGIWRGDYPAAIVIHAQPLYGHAGCAAPLYPNGAPAQQPATFPAKDFVTVQVALTAPTSTEDSDGDGFAGGDGPDCQDGNADVNPEAAEVCTQGEDRNCNNLVGCADPACAQVQCVGDPNQLAFVTAAQRLVAGGCSGETTVEAQDAAGAPRPVVAATPLALTGPAGMEFFSDPACTQPVSTAYFAPTESRTSFFFRTERAGAATVTVSVVGVSPVAQVQTIDPGPPAAIAFASAPQTLVAGSCSAPVSVRVEDSFGNLATLAASRTAQLTAAPATGFTFFSDAGCGTGISQVTLPAASPVATFYVRGLRAPAQVTVTADASAAGLGMATQLEALQVGPAARLAFTTPSYTVSTGACSPQVLFEIQDAAGNQSPLGTATPVLLASSASGVSFYSDPACATAITQVSLPAGAPQGGFFFGGTTATLTTLTATATGLATASQDHTLAVGGATTLVFTSAAQTVTAGNCSGRLDLETRDSFGQVSPVAATTVVSLSALPATGVRFFSNSSCGTQITDLTLSAGASTARFYFESTAAGLPQLTASAPGLNPAVQTQTVNAATAAKIVITSGAQTVTAGVCSAAVSVERRDGFDNAAGGGALTLTLGSNASPAGSFTFYSDPGCGAGVPSVTIPAAASSQVFYFRSTRTGVVTVTVNSSLGATTQVETTDPGPAEALAFTTGTQTVTAGVCSQLTAVRSEDTLGNAASVSAATQLTLGGPGTVTFFAEPTCTSTAISQVTLASGQSTASFYFKGSTAGAATITASATGFSPASQTETINPPSASVLMITTGAQTVVAGQCSASTTVQTQDAFGSPANVGAALTVSLSANPAGGFGFYSNSNCNNAIGSVTVNSGSSTANFYFRGNTSGTVTVTAQATSYTAGSQQETISAGTPNALAIPSAAQTVVAGSCSGRAVVEVRDSLGNPSPVGANLPVNLTTNATSGFTFYSDPSCATPVTGVTISAGSAQGGFYFRANVSGTPSVTAAAGGLGSASQVETVNPGPASRINITSGAQSIAAGACSAVVQARTEDLLGNPANVTGTTQVNLTTTGGATFGFFSNGGCTSPVTQLTLAGGQSAVPNLYFKDTTAGTPTITLAAGGLGSASQVETIRAATPSRLAFTSGAQTVVAGACSAAATVQVQDAQGNASPVTAVTTVNLTGAPDSGTDWRFFNDAACTTEVTSLTVTVGSSTGQLWFKGTLAGTVVVTAASTGLTSGTQSETIQAGAAARVDFVTAAQTVLGRRCSALTQVQIADALGNRVASARTVALTAAPTTGFAFYSDSACTAAVTQITTAASGLGDFYFSSYANGPVTITAASTGLTSGTQVETINHKLVKSGTCSLNNGATQTAAGACAISPAVINTGRAILFFQAVGPGVTPLDTQVTCELTSTEVICKRLGTANTIGIAWYVAEFASQVSVQHLPSVACPDGATTVNVPITTVNTAQSFVLMSVRKGTNDVDGSNFATAALTANNQVTLTLNKACNTNTTFALQVVQYPGATVSRGTTTIAAVGYNTTVTFGTAAATDKSFLTYSWRYDPGADLNFMCNRMIRGAITSTTGAVFSRSNSTNAVNCNNQVATIHYERVTLPTVATTKVQHIDVPVAAGTTSGTSTIPAAVDLNRAAVFLGGQGGGGSATGEMRFESGDYPGEGRARFVFNSATQLGWTRGLGVDSARFGAQVVEFTEP